MFGTYRTEQRYGTEIRCHSLYEVNDMLISKRNTETEKKLYSSNEEIMEAEELLYNVINSSLNTAGDNFEIEDNICEIEYNYDKDEIKQPTKIVINFGTLLLIIILVIIIIIAIISKIKTKE